MRTRSQVYSEKVFDQISNIKNNNWSDKQKKQYGSLCHSFPVMVLQSGLSQAVAFVWIKAKNTANSPHGVFLQNLAALTRVEENSNPDRFQQAINRQPLNEYQRMTREILAASIWYKRFAESLLDVKAGDEAGESHDD